MNWREIPLTRGYVAIVDEADYDDLAQFKWSVVFSGAQRNRPVARRTFWLPGGRWMQETMHRRLLPSAVQVDHINGNSLDNRRANLRSASHAENQRNQGGVRANNSSGFRGVSWTSEGKWRAQIQADQPGRRQHLGYHGTPEAAARAFDLAAVRIYGEFAGRLNFPDEVAG